MKNYTEEWYPLPIKFRDISATEDDQREFLEDVSKFRRVEKRGWIADSGFSMSNIGSTVVGVIHGIEFIPDENNDTDGTIVVLKRDYLSNL